MTGGDRSTATTERQRGLEWMIVGLAAIYFLGRLLYFAIAIAPDVPPDEETHVGIGRLYSQSPLLIEDSPASYRHGLVTHVPFLYHLLMGKLLAVNLFGIDSHLYLRLWNVLLSMGTLAVAYMLARLMTKDWRVRVLFVILATNTLMLTFLSASVSYDNLVNLLAISSIYLLASFLISAGGVTLLLFLLTLLLGALTKYTFLPLAVLLLALLVVDRRRVLAQDVRRLRELLAGRRMAPRVLAALVLVLAMANLILFGGNLVRYGRVDPTCDQVLGVEPCMENRIFARNWVVSQYRLDVLSYEDAVRQTSRISHAGDRNHALRLLENERWFKSEGPEALNVVDYVKLVWTQGMRPTIYGIQAHQSMLKQPNDLMPYSLVFLLGFFLWARGVSWQGEERLWLYLAGVAILYFLFLVGWVNYRGYLTSHAPLLGVQGRYVFPVILPAYLVLARSLLGSFRQGIRIALLVVMAAIFILGDYPYFRSHASPAWFTETPSTAGGTSHNP